MVKHVPAIGILLVVQGALEALGALLGLVYGVLYGSMAALPLAGGASSANGEAEGMMAVFGGMGVLFVLVSLAVLVAGGVKIAAGVLNYRYRKRTLGLCALASAMVSTLTCYCAPTGLALALYGLIVYMHDEVKKAFEMGEGGFSTDDVLRYALERRRGPYRDPGG